MKRWIVADPGWPAASALPDRHDRMELYRGTVIEEVAQQDLDGQHRQEQHRGGVDAEPLQSEICRLIAQATRRRAEPFEDIGERQRAQLRARSRGAVARANAQARRRL